MKNIYTTGQVAKICHTSVFTVQRWINLGLIKAYRISPTSRRQIPLAELLRFMREKNIPLTFLKADKSILIVDDDPKIVTMLKREFFNDGWKKVEVALTGFDAGRKIERLKPDVIILDIYLGDMDGREVLNHIRSEPELSNTHVIAISGYFSDEEKKKLIKIGFDDFIAKPFTGREVLEKVKLLIEKF
jgi:two-component system, OmpR family, response regulator RpaA